MGLTVHRIRGDRPRVKIPWWMGLTQAGASYRRYDMIPFCWIYRFFRQLGHEMTNFFELCVDIPYWKGLSAFESDREAEQDDDPQNSAHTYIKGIRFWRIHIRWRNQDLATLVTMKPYLWVGFQYGVYDEIWSAWLLRKPTMVPRRASGANPEFQKFSARSRVDPGGRIRLVSAIQDERVYRLVTLDEAMGREREQLQRNRRDARLRHRENRRRRSGITPRNISEGTQLGRTDPTGRHAVADTRATREIAAQDQRNIASAALSTENAEARMRDIDVSDVGTPVTEAAVDLALEDTRQQLQAIHDDGAEAGESAAGRVFDSLASIAGAEGSPAQPGDGGELSEEAVRTSDQATAELDIEIANEDPVEAELAGQQAPLDSVSEDAAAVAEPSNNLQGELAGTRAGEIREEVIRNRLGGMGWTNTDINNMSASDIELILRRDDHGEPPDRRLPIMPLASDLDLVGMTRDEWRHLTPRQRRLVRESIVAIRATLPRTQEDPVRKVHRARLVQTDEDRSEQERDGTPSGSEEGD